MKEWQLELAPRATDVITCGRCGGKVMRRGYAAHKRAASCEAAIVERRMAERGWVRAGALATKLTRAGCPRELAMGSVGKRFRLVCWVPQWAVDEHRVGESSRDMMKRLAPEHESVAMELALALLSGDLK